MDSIFFSKLCIDVVEPIYKVLHVRTNMETKLEISFKDWIDWAMM